MSRKGVLGHETYDRHLLLNKDQALTGPAALFYRNPENSSGNVKLQFKKHRTRFFTHTHTGRRGSRVVLLIVQMTTVASEIKIKPAKVNVERLENLAVVFGVFSFHFFFPEVLSLEL